MEERARAEFEKLTRLGSTLERNLINLEGHITEMVSNLTLPPPEKDFIEAHQILDSLVDYWKNLCEEIEAAKVQQDEENAELSEQIEAAEASLAELEERREECAKYVSENLNISLGMDQLSVSNQDIPSGDTPSVQPGLHTGPRPEADADNTFLLPNKFYVRQLSPGDDNTDNTVLEFK